MVNCGTTGVIPDCLGAQNSTWKITYNVPEPGYVRYKYGSGDWVNVIGGVRYTTEINASSNNIAVNLSDGNCITVDCNATGILLSGTALNGEGNYIPYQELRTVSSQPICMNLVRSSVSFNPWKGQTFYNVYINGTTNIVGWLTDVRGIQVSCQGCLFKVFNNDNQVIYQETRDVCPTAEVVPCQYNPENEKSISVNPGQIGIAPLLAPKGLVVYYDVEIPSGRKATFVKVESFTGFIGAPLPGNDVTLLELISPEGCELHPKVCWECKPCKGCPEGTCIKCLDRKTNKICCYGSNGQVIATVEPDCDTPDC